MSMEMTCLDFQLSTDNQNDRQLPLDFQKFFRNLVYISFGVCEFIGIVRFYVRPITRLWQPFLLYRITRP